MHRYFIAALICLPLAASAQEPLSVKDLAAKVTRSIVVITLRGPRRLAARPGHRLCHRQDGLIATNLHVIGEARPISVQTADGKIAAR